MTLRDIETDPVDCRKMMDWMTQAGVTVESIENPPSHTCSVCQPVDLHVAA